MIPEEVQDVFVERSLVVRQQSIAKRTYKVVNWLKLLTLYEQDKNEKAYYDVIRNQIHQNFIMQEGFWVGQAIKRFAKKDISRDDIELLLLATDDGTYQKIALMVADKVIELYRSKTIRQNFCLSVLQKLISLFSFNAVSGEFFQRIRQVYKQMGDTQKIRASFQRQMRLAHDNFDLVWDEYELWQEDKKQLDKNKDLYMQAKIRWQREAVQFDQSQYSESNVKMSLFILQNTNQSKIDEKRYLEWLQKLPNQSQKLWFLRRIALNYRQLLKPYLLKLQAFYSNDEEQLIKKYKIVIRLSDNNPEIQLKYLHFLVRRISKHLLNEPLPPEYNNNWSNNVVIFRNQVTSMIEKSRVGTSPENIKSIFIQYYKLWIEVQSRIVKDKDSVSQLYEKLLKETSDVKVYQDYANSLLSLSVPKQAKNVLKRYFIQASDERSQDIYLNFIQMYGTIQDQIQYHRDLKSNGIQQQILKKKQQMDIQSSQKESQKNKSNSNDHSQKHIIQSQQSNQQNKLKRERVQIKDQTQQKISSLARKRLHVDGQHTVYLKGIPTTWSQSDVLKILTHPQAVVRVSLVIKNSEQKDYCYIEYSSKQSAQQQVKLNKSNYKLYISKPPSQYDESSTLFLCALPHTATQQKIKQIFKEQANNIVDIRLKLDKEKNYAYVQFSSPALKQMAYELSQKQNMIIDGKKILVQYCNSNRSKTKKFLPVVFLKNVAFKTQQKDIREFFAGKIISKLSIPLGEDKRPRGFAYVEFQKFIDYQQALDMKRGILHGRQFQILRSDREITLPKHEPQSENKKEEHTSKPKQDRKKGNRRNRQPHSREPRTNEPQVKDNNYFSSLFK